MIYKLTVSNLMINKNTYFFLQNIQYSNYYSIKCNILVLLVKYLNNNFFLINVNILLIKIKRNYMHSIVYSYS